jgi:hypothetical protein
MHPNDYFILLLLPLLPSPWSSTGATTAAASSSGGGRTVVTKTYAGKSRLIVNDNCKLPQDFSRRLMRRCIKAFGPHGFPCLELAKASCTMFLAMSYTVSSGDWQEPLSMLSLSSSSSMAFAHNQHRCVLLRQYLDGVLGLAEDGHLRAAR